MLLYLATGNAHKLDELRALAPWPGVEWRTLRDAPGFVPPEETGATFAENAVIKAEALAAFTGQAALADDSGLEVDGLGGAPGVYSARYAGVHGDDAANNRKLLAELGAGRDRRARFRCVLALSHGPGRTRVAAGACEGRIAAAPAGAGGFGYDPLFIPDGFDRTFAELGAEVKNRLSHRAAAMRAAVAAWTDLSVP
jgi:XTP/dITP diphosphohydrolase